MSAKSSPQPHFSHPKFWPAWLFYGLARVVLLLPFPVLIAIGRKLGWLMLKLGKSRREVVEVNAKLAFPEMTDGERQRFVSQVFEENGIGFIESLMAWWGDEKDLLSRVEYQGLEHLLEAHQQGNGVLLVGAHYSTLELGGLFIGNQIQLDTVYRRHNNPLLEHLITSGRSKFCAVIEKRELRTIFRKLKDNHCVWYAPDQDMGDKNSVYVPFFGHDAATVNATARMAAINHSPVLICSHHRNADNRSYTVRISPVVENYPSGDLHADTARINQLLEAEIRRHPEQYLWLHKRYKTQPDGRNKLYQP